MNTMSTDPTSHLKSEFGFHQALNEVYKAVENIVKNLVVQLNPLITTEDSKNFLKDFDSAFKEYGVSNDLEKFLRRKLTELEEKSPSTEEQSIAEFIRLVLVFTEFNRLQLKTKNMSDFISKSKETHQLSENISRELQSISDADKSSLFGTGSGFFPNSKEMEKSINNLFDQIFAQKRGLEELELKIYALERQLEALIARQNSFQNFDQPEISFSQIKCEIEELENQIVTLYSALKEESSAAAESTSNEISDSLLKNYKAKFDAQLRLLGEDKTDPKCLVKKLDDLKPETIIPPSIQMKVLANNLDLAQKRIQPSIKVNSTLQDQLSTKINALNNATASDQTSLTINKQQLSEQLTVEKRTTLSIKIRGASEDLKTHLEKNEKISTNLEPFRKQKKIAISLYDNCLIKLASIEQKVTSLEAARVAESAKELEATATNMTALSYDILQSTKSADALDVAADKTFLEGRKKFLEDPQVKQVLQEFENYSDTDKGKTKKNLIKLYINQILEAKNFDDLHNAIFGNPNSDELAKAKVQAIDPKSKNLSLRDNTSFINTYTGINLYKLSYGRFYSNPPAKSTSDYYAKQLEFLFIDFKKNHQHLFSEPKKVELKK